MTNQTVGKGIPYSEFFDTNVVHQIWHREYSGDADKLHKEGVEELIAVIAAINGGRRAKLFFSESEIAFYSGHALVALSKLNLTNQLDLTAYRKFLLLSLAPSKGGGALGTAAEWHANLSPLGKDTSSYMAKRLYLISQIAYQLEERYTTDGKGERRRIVQPLSEHPTNRDLFTAATNAATLFRQTKEKFRDVTLESAIKLALASLQRDGEFVPLELAVEFRPLKIFEDALSAALTFPNAAFFDFWSGIALPNELEVRGIKTTDTFFSDETSPETLKRGLEFLRADLERCRTLKASEPKDARKMSKEEFMKLLKSSEYRDWEYTPLAPESVK